MEFSLFFHFYSNVFPFSLCTLTKDMALDRVTLVSTASLENIYSHIFSLISIIISKILKFLTLHLL